MGDPWRDAQSVADLGQAMAMWLEGSIRTSPSCVEAGGPDPETNHLIRVLAAANRAGYVTTQSQPGETGPRWEQRAAVEGWVTDQRLLGRIRGNAKKAGLEIIAHRTDSGWRDGKAVSRVDGQDFTWFGRTMGRRKQIEYEWSGVGGKAVRELRTATYLTIIDPVWGRDTVLWPALQRAVRN